MVRTEDERVIRCQSAVRGFLVRRRMKRVKNEYLRIVAEIEGPTGVDPSILRTDPVISAGNDSRGVNDRSTHNDSLYNKMSTDGNFKHLSPSTPTSPCRIGLENLSVEELEELKVRTAFELIWVHDSVQTRKEYLRS